MSLVFVLRWCCICTVLSKAYGSKAQCRSTITYQGYKFTNNAAVYDVEIVLDSGVRIESFIKNGYHHFDDEQDQWMFFKQGDNSYPFITVRNKTVDIAENW